MPVRVLINALHARSGGGVTYLRNLLPRLGADPDLEVHLCLHENQAAAFPEPAKGVRLHSVRFRDGFVRRLIWEQTALPLLARRIGAEVTFSPANFGPLLAPAPVVLLRNAVAVGESERRLSKCLYWITLGAMTRVSLLRCRRAVAVSEYARDALTRRLPPRVAGRVEVIHHGVDPLFSPPPPGQEREDFVLAVSDLYIQKNLHRLLDALAILRPEFPRIRLRIAGGAPDAEYARDLRRTVAERELGDHVRFLGHVAVPALADLYRRCALFVFPSLVETFGNPLAEAMASGAPIVSSDTAAMPEVLGEAALFFDPRDTGAMAERIAAALGDADLRRRLGARALDRAAHFSWDETARRTARVILSCAVTA
ncbi:MAG: glycosyltransferase family 1 protein [Rhodospirillales bacterium]|jgi:glycosyltransferase involved in cell wall biosynthesis|nr:glycosyltransferase family 1 protein [Rhodospirillales bacterium]MDP6882767.1 glycosyltransferase family 1 protein [Rhodospirillales bacterium]